MRELVLAYYTVLRSALKQKRGIRAYLTRCADCGISFIADPRNALRGDLRCPFGCREARRRRRSTERSVAYYRTPEGKVKKKAQNQNRRKLVTRQDGMLGQNEAGPGVDGGGSTGAARTTTRAVPAAREELGASVSSGEVADRAAEKNGDVQCGNALESGGKAEAGQEPESYRIPIQGPAPEMDFNRVMVSYVQMTTSLLEGRRVDLDEVLEMLVRVMRQHRMPQRPRIDYIVWRLNQKGRCGPARTRNFY